MSRVRETHPGYFGVLMAIALTWYCGLGLTFLFQGDSLRTAPSYKLVMHYIPPVAWGSFYLSVGMAIIIGANVKAVAHKYVRVLVLCGMLTTIFFLVTFIVFDIYNGVPPATLIPSFASMALVEYRALVEPERNPAMIARRIRNHKSGGSKKRSRWSRS